MNKLRSVLLCMLGLFLISGPFVSAAEPLAIEPKAAMKGTGTANNPYVIETADHLYSITLVQSASMLKSYYVLGANIDISSLNWKPFGKRGAEFTGSFDGNGYTITGLKASKPADQYVGFFGRVKDATLKNIVLTNVSVNGSGYTGGLAGASENSTIENCSVSGHVSSTDKVVGGLVGYNGGKIVGSFSTGTVTGNHHVGGLVGQLQTDPDIGPATIESSYSLSDVSSSLGADGNYIGGLVGSSLQGTVKTSYAAGRVTGNPDTSGGLFGAGGTKLGYRDTFIDNVWNRESTGRSNGVGSPYEGGPDPAGNQGLTGADMRQVASYPGWDFKNDWILGEDADHPILRKQMAAMKVQSIRAVPQRLHLLTNRTASFSVYAALDDGHAYNITGLADYSTQPPGLFQEEKQAEQYLVAAGSRPGSGSILIAYRGQTASVPVAVSGIPLLADVRSSPSRVSADGQYESEVALTVQDEQGQPYSSLEVSLDPGGGETDIDPPSGTTDENGEARFTVKSPKTGRIAYQVKAPAYDLEMGEVAVDFRPGPASPAHTSVEPKSQVVVLEGEARGVITVALKDALNTPIAGHQLALVRLDGAPIDPDAIRVTDGEGRAEFAVTNSTAETVAYQVLDLDDQAEAGEAEITFVANTVDRAKSSFRAMPSMVVADDATEAALTLVLKNAADLPIAGRQVDLHLGSTDEPVIASETTDAEGKATFRVKSAAIGARQYAAVAHVGETAELFAVTVDFVADEIDVDASGYEVSDDEARADGSESVNVLVTLRDKLGHPVQGGRVELEQTGESLISPTSAVTDGAGEARFSIASHAIETVSYTVMTPKGALGSAFQIRFADYFRDAIRAESESYGLKVGDTSDVKVYADYKGGEKEVSKLVDGRSTDASVAEWQDGKIVAEGVGSARITISYLGAETDIAVTVTEKEGGGNPDPGSGPDPTPGPTPNPTPSPTPDPTPNPTPSPSPNPTPNPGTGSGPGPVPQPGPSPDGGHPGTQPERPPISLTDIGQHWAKESIKAATQSGIAFGYPDGTFRPDRSITRAEFTAMLVRALGLKRIDGDVPALSDWGELRDWSREGIGAAWQAGIVSGYGDGSFRPDAEITRVEMTVMIVRALGGVSGSGGNTSFADEAAIPAWARGDVAIARERGIVQGRSGNRFDPLASATRAESVALLMRLLDVLKSSPFAASEDANE
ncbi:Ig-like domain-containing protein [Cohnella sp. REN36]|uniref:Ig-like domain-containing protein n=1 Tax=Cohnella sp. REN36 TaxID=2887347 RepID=UPI001D15B37F|nr:Ig-like domain-containing protein [Cohnella sp. REN36]MCC3374257.1 Ig-like domain-containing protein [Cohnella sp. REN36]